MSPDATYVAHTTTAATVTGGIVVIAAYVSRMKGIDVPAEVSAAAVGVLLPFVSWALKKTGIASA